MIVGVNVSVGTGDFVGDSVRVGVNVLVGVDVGLEVAVLVVVGVFVQDAAISAWRAITMALMVAACISGVGVAVGV